MGTRARRPAAVALNRALSKLGVLSRAQATEAIRAGRVRVDGEVVRDVLAPVVPERARIDVDGQPSRRAPWRTLVFNKPRGVITSRRDPQGRKTVYDVVGEPARGLMPVGRLDYATSGLLLLTNDTRLAHWITDPINAIPRIYLVTVRGWIADESIARLMDGCVIGSERLGAADASLRKRSRRESHLTLTLVEGRNREVRRLLAALGHEVTRLTRVQLGGLTLGGMQPGEWRDVARAELYGALPGAPLAVRGPAV